MLIKGFKDLVEGISDQELIELSYLDLSFSLLNNFFALKDKNCFPIFVSGI